MANNCLVTKLKGVVDNPNIPYFGQLTFKLYDTNKPSQQVIFIGAVSNPINYIATGITTLSTSQGGSQIPMSGTFSTNTAFWWTGPGEIKFWSKFGFGSMSVNSRAAFKNIEELYYLENNLQIQSYSQFTVVDSLSKDIYFTNGEQRLIILRNLEDYSKIHVAPGQNIYIDMRKLDETTGQEIKNGYGLYGDMNNILNVQGISLQSIKSIEAYEGGLYFSNINAFNGAPIGALNIHNVELRGNIVEAFTSWTQLYSFTFEKSTNVEWKPVLDGWKPYRKNTSVYCVCNGTIDGVRIDGGFRVIYDSNGNWTYERL